MAGSQTDITGRKVAEERLVYDAFHDVLTGLPNRALFMDRLTHTIKRTTRNNKNLFAVIFINMDRFKIINDSLGHMIGDQLLIAVSQRLEECLRPGDTVARLGGDEFAILLEDIKEDGNATHLIERIQKKLSLPFNLNGQEVFITVSIGVTLSDIGYNQPEDLLRDADIAMYHAKANGKARYEVFNAGMYDNVVTSLQLETDLRRAIDNHELRLHYQPIVLLKTGRITGFEALLRWYHPVRGLIYPTEFIPIAEETGLIVPIGEWVLHEACRQMRLWQEQFPSDTPLTVSVNISSKQFLHNLIEQVTQIFQKTDLEASSLILEITESMIMENAESIAPLLLQLKDVNVKLQIDDFGTGYSSLSYLHHFPIDALKIDRSFIKVLGIEDEKLEIVRAIITLAHNLNMDVIAEGVETEDQVTQLKMLKCEYMQGYLFSKPLNSKAVETFLLRQSRTFLFQSRI